MGPAEQHGLGRSGGLGLSSDNSCVRSSLDNASKGSQSSSWQAQKPGYKTSLRLTVSQRHGGLRHRLDLAKDLGLKPGPSIFLSRSLSERLSQRERERDPPYLPKPLSQASGSILWLAVMLRKNPVQARGARQPSSSETWSISLSACQASLQQREADKQTDRQTLLSS